MRAQEFTAGNAAKRLADTLRNKRVTDYSGIDRIMRKLAAEHGVTPDRLHSLFVDKYGVIPDTWIKRQLKRQIKKRTDESYSPRTDNDLDNNPLMQEFLDWTCRKLAIKNRPRFIWSTDTDEAQGNHHTGGHVPGSGQCWVYVKNRNLVDIMRTVFHELVHVRQDECNMIKSGDSYPGSPIEVMADALAGKYIKIFGKQNPRIYEGAIPGGGFGSRPRDFEYIDKTSRERYKIISDNGSEYVIQSIKGGPRREVSSWVLATQYVRVRLKPLRELAPGGSGGDGGSNPYGLWTKWFNKLDSELEKKCGVKRPYFEPGHSGFEQNSGIMGQRRYVSYFRVYRAPYYSIIIEIKPELPSAGISTVASVRFVANVDGPNFGKTVYPQGEITVSDQVSKLVGRFEQLVTKLNHDFELKPLRELAPGGSGGDGGDNYGGIQVYHAVFRDKTDRVVYKQIFQNTRNEDEVRDRIILSYPHWRLLVLWREGDPPIETRVAEHTVWFIEYEVDGKKSIDLKKLSGRITTEAKAREYFDMYFPSWKILKIRRMK